MPITKVFTSTKGFEGVVIRKTICFIGEDMTERKVKQDDGPDRYMQADLSALQELVSK